MGQLTLGGVRKLRLRAVSETIGNGAVSTDDERVGLQPDASCTLGFDAHRRSMA